MHPWSPTTVPSFGFRRDFADEAGLGLYLQKHAYGEAFAPLRQTRNRNLLISPSLPQYIAYDVLSDVPKVRLTLNADHAVTTTITRMFQTLLDRVAAYSEQLALDRAPTKSPDPPWSIILAKPDRSYTNVMLHCSHSGRAWIVPYSPELLNFLSRQD
jgi:hypothetical protein